MSRMFRKIDIIFSLFGLLISFPLLVVIYILNGHSALFLQERVGRNKVPFILIKFRTLKQGTESVATHLLTPESVTRFGMFLRRSKLDELPQLWNVLIGDMSIVGPRPNLFNQKALIAERDALSVYRVRPGITGLAQINEIDMSTPELLAMTDAKMIKEMSIANYFRFIMKTLAGKGSGDRFGGG